MSIWQHILKFCEDNRRQKEKKIELECTSCQLSRQQMRTGKRQHKDRSAELSLYELSVSIHPLLPAIFSLEQAGDLTEHMEANSPT